MIFSKNPFSKICFLLFAAIPLSVFLSGCGGGGGGGGDNPTASSVGTTQTTDFATMASKVKSALAKIRARKLNSRDHTPWVINSALFALGKDLEVNVVESAKTMKAPEYLCTEARYDNKLIYRTLNGQPALPTRDISFGLTESFKIQDHVDQFLSVLAEVGVATSQTIIADDGANYTVGDLVNASLRNFKSTQEFAWTLIALAVYNGLEKSFTTDSNETYKISDIMSLAAKRDTSKEARWGAHHLYAMAYALRMHLNAGGKFEGSWEEARAYLENHVRLAKNYQQTDGAFSANMFWGSSYPDSPDTLLETTVHMMIWHDMSLTSDQLREEWIVKAINRLALEILNYDFVQFGESGIYMSAHALQHYSTLLNLP